MGLGKIGTALRQTVEERRILVVYDLSRGFVLQDDDHGVIGPPPWRVASVERKCNPAHDG
jgi:hypothetical protein